MTDPGFKVVRLVRPDDSPAGERDTEDDGELAADEADFDDWTAAADRDPIGDTSEQTAANDLLRGLREIAARADCLEPAAVVYRVGELLSEELGELGLHELGAVLMAAGGSPVPPTTAPGLVRLRDACEGGTA